MKTLLLLTVVAVVATHRVHHGSHGFRRPHGGVPRPGGGSSSGFGNAQVADYDRIVYPDSSSSHGSGLPVRPGHGRRPVRPGVGGRPVRPGVGVGAAQGVRPALGPVGGGADGALSLRQCKPYIRSQVHYQSDAGEYHFSWCSDKGRKYTWEDANTYCKQLGRGWGGLSIESAAENKNITDIIDKHQLPYIWTSGNRFHDPYTTNVYNWVWDATGQKATYYSWGKTGAVPGRPQPDNHENGNEQCLSLLNRFYPGDGITWHDIGCHHLKPIICKRQSPKIYYR